MALQGSVRCRCWESNQTTDPPVKVFLDKEGDDIVPVSDDRDPAYLAKLNKVRHWLEECCTHPGMNFVYVHMPSFRELSEFVQALNEAGLGRFPALKDAIPGTNHGLVPPETAAQANVELTDFEEQPPFGDCWCIVDSQTEAIVYKHLDRQDPMLPGGVELQRARLWRRRVVARFGVGDGRFFVVRSSPARDEEIFSASAFRQEIDEASYVEFTDLGEGGRFRCEGSVHQRVPPWKIVVPADENGRHSVISPAKMHIERRQIGPGDFRHTIENFRRLFQASVTTCNPVRWH